MHRPDEVEPELRAAGFEMHELLAVESVLWAYPNAERDAQDPVACERLLRHVTLLEREPSLLGASAHFISIARKG